MVIFQHFEQPISIFFNLKRYTIHAHCYDVYKEVETRQSRKNINNLYIPLKETSTEFTDFQDILWESIRLAGGKVEVNLYFIH